MKRLLVVAVAFGSVALMGCGDRRGSGSPSARLSYTLDDGVALNQQFPDTFEIPSVGEREGLKPGQLAKLIFRISHEARIDVERMWVIVKERHQGYYIGTLDNDPYCTREIRSGMIVRFGPEHVIQV